MAMLPSGCIGHMDASIAAMTAGGGVTDEAS
jgi:hypothetical protein